MKRTILLAMVLWLLVSGCGGYLAHQNNEMWVRTFNQDGVDKEKFAIDHGDCSSYAAMMINIPFADGLGAVSSTNYYERCMKKKGYRK